ncbi:septum site-determining protein MinC [Klebsiella michiganensis]|nr:septum site-determining protein MinC [Klebsiella michiganensis]
MSNTPIELKGSSFTLSVVHLHDANPEVIRQALEDKIAQAPAFLRHAPVVVNISSIEDDVDWRPLHEAIAATGLRIMGVSGCKLPRLKTEIDRAGIPLCDLIVTNHVSAGAELIADGNIHVYGMMRGRALAGAGGDRDAQIFCTNLSAELVSIAGEYWLSDNIPAEFYGKAARLRLDDSALTIQSLN